MGLEALPGRDAAGGVAVPEAGLWAVGKCARILTVPPVRDAHENHSAIRQEFDHSASCHMGPQTCPQLPALSSNLNIQERGIDFCRCP